MRSGAWMQAAVEVLDSVFKNYSPASEALANWGRTHRFAGSTDRAAIGNLVFDVLRRRQSLAAQMGDASVRALVLAAAPRALGLPPEAIMAAADGSAHAILPLSAEEQAGLVRSLPPDLPPHIAGDVPEWSFPHFQRVFGPRAVAEGKALTARAPVDLRVNTLLATREKVLRALARFGAAATPLSPVGVRLAPPQGAARPPAVEAEPAHAKGWYEVQDEGSQLAALLAGARPRTQVLDFCAGAGGKTLAFAAAMNNTGQVYAYDSDKFQLRPIFERLKRAGVRNVQVLPSEDKAALAALGPRFDTVVVDAPCTGSGTWRRHPDAKWRLRPAHLAARLKAQDAVLAEARNFVKPGGRLVYITCSLFAEENTDRVQNLCAETPEFSLEPFATAWREHIGGDPPVSADGENGGLLLSPATHGTDGFYIAVLRRRA